MKTASKFCGFASLLLGVLVLIGWYTHSVTLIQVHPSFVAMQYNTALGFLICGIGLIAINLLKIGAVRFSAIFLMFLGGLTLIQYIFGSDLGIDQLLMEFYVDVKASHPGRMAPNTALCFFLVGLSFFISIQLQKNKTKANILGLLGGLILSLGSVALFGYLSGVETAYGWGNLTRMAVHTSLGFIILGVGIVFYAWKIEAGESNDIPKWFPVLVGLASITTTFLVCQAEVSDQKVQVLKQIQLISNHSKQKLQDELNVNIKGLERLAKRFGIREMPSTDELVSDADIYLADHESIHLIAFVDDEFHAQWITPLKGNEKYLGVELPQVLAHRDDLLKASVSKDIICFTVEMGGGKHGILAMIPAFRNNNFQGFIVGVIGFEQLFEEMLEGPYVQGISGLLYEEASIKRKNKIESWKNSPWLVRNSFDVSGKTWQLWLKPDQKWLDTQSSSLPDVILIVGAFISLFMMMFVHLMIKARYYANETATMNLALKKAHDELEVRIEERTDELKESEDQFRTLVNNIPGVSYRCLIDENWTMIYISDAVKNITGYPPSDFIHNKVRTFDSVNHPDDREKIARAVEESINSKEPFEIEYRMLHSDGRVIWVTEKGQVRFDNNGEVAFLDGAIFDITDQKMAEEELRKINKQSDTALDLTKAGYWYIPLVSDPGYYISSEKAVAIFGDLPRPGHRYHIMDEWFANVKAGDEEAAKITMEKFEGALEGRYPLYDATFAYKRPVDGQIVWIHALAYVSRNKNGDPTDMYGVTQDITESKLLESQLRDASTKAEQANKAKSIFISSMSHEIRTPMNAILGYSQILGRDKELNEKQKKGVESIHRAGKHLLDIINDILDFSKIEAGKMELHPHDFDLGSLVQDLVVFFSGKCKEKNLELRTEGIHEGQKIYVHAEASKLRQVLVNLMGNAVKFTESGAITLRVMPLAGDQFYFEVKDTGQGIQSEKLESIFESFQQDEEGIKKGGTGLGLVIAKQIVSAMGGELEVESELGKGSKFFFSISLSTAKAEVKDKDDRLTRAIGLAQGHSVKTVLIDDNQDNIDVLAATLMELGVEVTEAESGLEGLEKIREIKPDIIFVDYHMPGMDGLEVAKRVQDEYGQDTIKIVMISASTFDHHREQYMKEGIHGFVGKPFIREEILGIMARLLNLEYEFDKDIVPEEALVSSDIDFSKIKLPEVLHTSVKEMASMGMMEELEEFLPRIKEIGPDGRNLAACLQGMVEQFDMDGIIKILEEVESE